MAFKSKAQMAKLAELVKAGKIKQTDYDHHLAETPEVHKLPERVVKLPEPVSASRRFISRKKT